MSLCKIINGGFIRKAACLAAATAGFILFTGCTPSTPDAPSPPPTTPAVQTAANLSAPTAPTADVPQSVEVTISRKEYTPGAVTVPQGSTVTWVNRSDEMHSVISADKLFNAPIPIEGSFSYTFKQTGTFSYYCEVWPEMAGTVYVK